MTTRPAAGSLSQYVPRHDRQDGLLPLLVHFGAGGHHRIIDHERRSAACQRGIQDKNAHATAAQARTHASSKLSRGERLNTPLQSP